MKIRSVTSLGACAALTIAAACSDAARTPSGPSPSWSATTQTATLIAVGDIGQCGSPAVAQTARLADGIEGQVVLAGDLAYPHGSMRNFIECFDPDWGSNRRRWRPVPGNHEYETPFAAGYFQYFGEAAGIGHYAFRAGDWLVLMLNSNVDAGPGSAQYEFARGELVANRGACAMAVWHHPLFSSGPNGPSLFMRELWSLLQGSGVDVIVAAHEHFYERFGKQDTVGRSDPGGIRQFIVGTGGARLYNFQRMAANSQARIAAHGVLRLTLNPASYDWAFIDITGSVADAGADSCH
ncbi:MAG: metallophosphoesterase family protein [Vicinamibacterales bacterium]